MKTRVVNIPIYYLVSSLLLTNPFQRHAILVASIAPPVARSGYNLRSSNSTPAYASTTRTFNLQHRHSVRYLEEKSTSKHTNHPRRRPDKLEIRRHSRTGARGRRGSSAISTAVIRGLGDFNAILSCRSRVRRAIARDGRRHDRSSGCGSGATVPGGPGGVCAPGAGGPTYMRPIVSKNPNGEMLGIGE